MARTPQAPDFAALLDNSGWVRGLAGNLVRDPNVADDLAQDAYVAVLVGRGRPEPGLRRWLGGVVRNLARREQRSAGRRRRRESAVARPDTAPPAERLLEQAELQKRVIGAVTELDEPYRSTILMRFFEGLSVEELARRQGVAGSTGRTRLQRALEKLRERFDREHGGDRSAWSALLLPLVPDRGALPGGATGTAGIGLTKGVLVMSTMAVKGVGAAAIVAVGLFGFWHWRGEAHAVPAPSEEMAASDVDALVDPGPTSVELLEGPAVAREERRAIASAGEVDGPIAPEVAPASAGAFGQVRARIVDELGSAIAGARFELEDVGAARSAADGEVELAVPMEGERTSVSVTVRHPGRTTRLLESAVRRDETTHLGEIALGAAGALSGVVLDQLGDPVPGARVFASDVGKLRSDPAELRRHGPYLLRPVPETRTDTAGRFELDGVATGFVQLWATAERYAYASVGPLEVTEYGRIDGLTLVLDELFEADRIEGVVLTPDGEPAASTSIRYSYRYSGGYYSSSMEVEEDGHFGLTLDHRVPYSLRAEDRKGRWADVLAQEVQPGTLDLVLRYRAPRWIEVGVTDEKGRAVEEFGLDANHARRTGAVEYGTIETVERGLHEDGVARLMVPTVPFEVVVDAPGYERLVLGPFEPHAAPDRLTARLSSLPGIHGRVLAGGQPIAGATVELCRVIEDAELFLRNGFRCRYLRPHRGATTTDEHGRYHLFPRQSGDYVLRVEKEGYAVSELELAVDAARRAEGIDIALGHGGTIAGRVLVAPGEEVSGVVVGLNRGDGEGWTFRVGPDGTYRFEGLAVGGWQVLLREDEVLPGSSMARSGPNPVPGPMEWTCHVFEGRTTHFDLDLREPVDVVLRGRLDLGSSGAAGWTASLSGSGELAMNKSSAATLLDGEGRFELEASQPGLHRLELRAPQHHAHGLVLSATLELVEGENTWSEALELGRIDGRGAPPESEDVLYYRWKGELSAEAGTDVSVGVRLAPDASGSFNVPFAPAGPGEIVLFERENGQPGGRWEPLVSFVIVAGQGQTIYLP